MGNLSEEDLDSLVARLRFVPLPSQRDSGDELAINIRSRSHSRQKERGLRARERKRASRGEVEEQEEKEEVEEVEEGERSG